MSFKIGKYEFDNKEQAESKIKALGVEIDDEGIEYPTHNHSVVKLGYIALKQGVYDEDLKEIEKPILSDKYHVDVLWKGIDDHPYGWASYAIEPTDNKGVHSFYGIDFKDNKAQRNGK